MFVLIRSNNELDGRRWIEAYEIPDQYLNSPVWANWFMQNFAMNGRVVTGAGGRPVLAATEAEARKRYGAHFVQKIGQRADDDPRTQPWWGPRSQRAFREYARRAQAQRAQSGRMQQLQTRASNITDRRSGFNPYIPQRAWGGAPPMLTHPGSQGYRIPPQATGGIPAQLKQQENQGWEKVKRIGRQGHRQY